jgi:bacteriorhodopsin
MFNPRTGQCTEPEEPIEPIEPYDHHADFTQQTYHGHYQEHRMLSYGQGQAPPARDVSQEGGYSQAKAQEYGDEGYEEELIDTSCGNIYRSGHAILWVTFAILFLTAWFLLWRSHRCRCCADECEIREDGHCTSINYFLSPACAIAGLVCLIASLSYLCMATGHGFYIQCFSARIFFYVRYIDWVITTPLLLWEIAHFGNASDDWWIFLVFNNLVLFVAGFIGATVEWSSVRWGFFAIAFLAFLPILYYLCRLSNQVCDNREYWCDSGLLVHEKDYGKDGTCYLPYIWFHDTLKRLVGLIALAWFIYPIIWVAAEGTWRLCVNGEIIAYAVLDIITKAVFGWIICLAAPCTKDRCKEKCQSGGCRLLMEFYD